VKDARRIWLATGGLLVLGCVALVLWFLQGSEPTATGTVQLDGQLLPRGSVALIPIYGTPGPGGGSGIDKGGNYEITQGLRAGNYRVEIRSTITLERKVLDPTIPTALVNEEVEVIHQDYNTNSKLVREIKPGANVLNFDLKGAAARR
jgi:hypothetical protein